MLLSSKADASDITFDVAVNAVSFFSCDKLILRLIITD